MPSPSIRRSAWRRCRAPTSGPTARPTSTTSSWCARRATPRCRRASTTDPLMYQGGSDDFLGPRDDDRRRAARTGASTSRPRSRWSPATCAMGATPEQALDGIRLVMLANDVSLRNLIPAELAKGFGFFQSKPATAFSPVAVTPDELGDAWQRRPRAPRRCRAPGTARKVGLCDAGAGDDLPLRPADRAHRARRATCAPAASSAAAPSATRTGRDGYSAASPRSARSRRSRTARRRPRS